MTEGISRTGSLVGHTVACIVRDEKGHVIKNAKDNKGVVIYDIAVPDDHYGSANIQIFFLNQNNEMIKADVEDITAVNCAL